MKKKKLRKLLEQRDVEVAILRERLKTVGNELRQVVLQPESFEAINIACSIKHFDEMERRYLDW